MSTFSAPMNPYSLPKMKMTQDEFHALPDGTGGGKPPGLRWRKWVALDSLGEPEARVAAEMTKTTGVWIVGEMLTRAGGVTWFWPEIIGDSVLIEGDRLVHNEGVVK